MVRSIRTTILLTILMMAATSASARVPVFRLEAQPASRFALEDGTVVGRLDNPRVAAAVVTERTVRRAAKSDYPFVDIDLLAKGAGRPAPRTIPTADLAPAVPSLSDLISARRAAPAHADRPADAVRPAHRSKSPPWSEDRLLADATGMNDGYVSMEVSPVSGDLYAVFEATDLGGTDRDIHIARSSDGGDTWSDWELPSFSQDEYMPDLAIDAAGFLHVVWIRDDGYIVRARSSSGDDPTDWAWVNGFHTGSVNATPSVAVTGAGDYARVFIAASYQEINYDWMQWEWTLVWMHSLDGGYSVSYDALVPDGYPDTWPDVAMTGTTVHLVNGETDPYTGVPRILIASDALAGGFTEITDLCAWTANACGFPRVAADGSTVVVVFQHDWQDELGNVDGDVIQYLSWDAGETLYGPHEVVADPYESVGPAVYVRDGTVGYLWLDGPAGADEFDVAARQGGGGGHPDLMGDIETVSDLTLAEPQYRFLSGAATADALHAAWIDRRDYMSGGLNVYTSRRQSAPNLTPFTPEGWAAEMVANMTPGVRETGLLAADQPVYFSFALRNDDLADVVGEMRVVVQVNGIPKAEWILEDGLPSGGWAAVEDHPLTLAGGEHEIRWTIDYQHQVDESDETDNVASRTWTWITGSPELRIDPVRLVHQADVPASNRVGSGHASPDDPPLKRVVWMDKIAPELAASIDRADKSARLPVIWMPTERVDTETLRGMLGPAKSGAVRDLLVEALRTHSAREAETLRPLTEGLEREGLMESPRALWLPGMFAADMSAGAVRALADSPEVGRLWLDDRPLELPTNPVSDRDPLPIHPASDQNAANWHLTRIAAAQAWARGYTGDGILVGHLDSGVCYDHPDLENGMWDGGAEWPHHGWDALDEDDDPYDGDTTSRHGTATAGLIIGDGSSGPATGAAPGAKVMALRVIPGYWVDMIEGMQFGLDHGPVDLFSMSAGWDDPAGDLKNANRMNADVLRDLDIPWVVAGGNGDNYGGHHPVPQDISSPADCPHPYYGSAGRSSVIAVGASGETDAMWSGSSVGPTVWDIDGTEYTDYPYPPGLIKPDLTAPGDLVISTWETSGYVEYSGTSLACPLAAGAMAILMEAAPEASLVELAAALEISAHDLGDAGRDNHSGAGLLDIPAALDALPTSQRAVFHLHNDGPLPLRILTMQHDQWWLAVDPLSGEIAPGDSLKCTADFATESLAAGVYRDRIEVYSNDPNGMREIPVTLLIGDQSHLSDAPAPTLTARTLRAHPNPFNPMTEIRFETTVDGPVQLCVHDLRGRRVGLLCDGERQAGEHRVKWDGRDSGGRSVPAGVYLLKLMNPRGDVTARKITLIR